MISRLGAWISRAFRRTAPDPFVIAVLLTLLTAVMALAFGFPEPPEGVRPGLGERALRLLTAWGDEGGLWSLLDFGMQMCLILVTGHALAASRPVRAALAALAGLPRTGAQAAALVALAACVAALINWGLGVIVGAFLAREVGREAARRGVAAHYPLLAAAGYTCMLIWHGGLSGSAPLTMTTVANARKVLPAGLVERLAGGPGAPGDRSLIPLDQTIGSTMNLAITGGLLVLVPLVCYVLAPGREASEPMGSFLPTETDHGRPASPSGADEAAGAVPERLETSLVIPVVLAAGLAAALVVFVRARGLGSIGLNEINAAMLALGLVLHGSPRSYLAAVEDGARGCAGIILQFPLYAGIIAMMTASGLVRILADALIAAGNERTIPLMSYLAACIVNIFVPSGGGQWAVQGPIALQSGLDAGIDPARMVMSVAYGDQLTNMLQPFWALPLLAITGVKARDIVGYTAIVMLVAGAWVALGLLFF